VLQAVSKFRVTREEASTPYRIAYVTTIPEALAEQDKPALHIERDRLEALAGRAADHVALPKIPPGISDEELVDGLAQFADIDPLDRQQLLEREGVLVRAQALIDLLQRLIAAPQ